MIKWIQGGIVALCSALLLLILGLILLCFNETSFACKRTFLLPQWGMLLLGSTVLVCLIFLFKRKAQGDRFKRCDRFAGWVFWPAVFVLQVTLCYFSYFLTGWDAGMMLEYAHWIGVFGYKEVNNFYYSMHPNNVLITMVFAWIIRLFTWVVGGEPGIDRCAFIVIIVQCLLNALTGAMCQSIVGRVMRSRRMSWVVAIVYLLLVGLSPWSMIPYTDSMTLFVPALILWLYLCRGEKGWPTWIAIGLLTGLGYLLKPQAVIVTIALVIVEALRWFARRQILPFARRMGMLLLSAAVMIGPVFDAVVHVSGFELDPQMNIGALHFMMMGLNEHTNGGFYAEDENITISVQTLSERKHVQMEEIKRRIEGYGFVGMMEHLKKKTLTNYADGSFAWGVEGQFFAKTIEDKDDTISPLLKSIIYPDENGKMPVHVTLCQCIWLGLLLGALCMTLQWRGLMQEEEKSRFALVMLLSVIGLTMFEWIFEARARYLYIYAPFYVMLGVMGIWLTLNRIQEKKH